MSSNKTTQKLLQDHLEKNPFLVLFENAEESKEETIDPVLSRMQEELAEITKRVRKLHAFRSGAKPEHISQTQWDLLLTQLHAMRIYQTTLITRCRLFGKNDD
jgi:hypothetical protein